MAWSAADVQVLGDSESGAVVTWRGPSAFVAETGLAHAVIVGIGPSASGGGGSRARASHDGSRHARRAESTVDRVGTRRTTCIVVSTARRVCARLVARARSGQMTVDFLQRKRSKREAKKARALSRKDADGKRIRTKRGVKRQLRGMCSSAPPVPPSGSRRHCRQQQACRCRRGLWSCRVTMKSPVNSRLSILPIPPVPAVLLSAVWILLSGGVNGWRW